jgi:hypothetical protein
MLLKIKNFGGKGFSSFGVKINLLEGNVGVVKINLTVGRVERSAFQ